MGESTFLGFICKFVSKLESHLRAPEASLIVQECNTLAENYSWRIVSACRQTYALGFRTTWTKGFEGSRFLLELAIREVYMLFDEPNFFRDGGDGHWCFDSYAHDWHTPETLSRAVYELVCARAFSRLHNSFGLDPLSISRVAGMAYESRNTEGEIAFHTGDLCGTWESIIVRPHNLVPFTEENARFIRKQFAGVGKNKLLFIRTGPNHPYAYAGYLNAGDKTFLSVWLKRDGMWVLSIGDRPVLQVKFRDVFLPEDPIGQVMRYLGNEFGDTVAEKLTPVLKALCGHKHGTSVIFVDEKDKTSQNMLNRLKQSGRALRVKEEHSIDKDSERERKILDEFLGDISSVDGAFIFDYCTCRLLYVNAIVDGLVLLPGRADCGSRHNALESAITTLVASDSSRQMKAAAVIFSEDGGISTVTATDCRKRLDENEGWQDQLPTLRLV